MLEYITNKGKKVTINPQMITMIMECDTPNVAYIYTADSPDPIRVMEPYEKVSKAFQKFKYAVQTVIYV